MNTDLLPDKEHMLHMAMQPELSIQIPNLFCLSVLPHNPEQLSLNYN